ncbi:hypothetical protein PILCRDRAFT_92272 [Piloderma croceum F 1598]|uniref:Uncharacterized protein n=1 Tax=Piloderma croceum (strain F 1598) TaxID=765440 RepID=A0A0C3AMD7_PILCF|nr:hypothetical protein PILCRDRAFT_92272 [Piloderma croceum F 1598]
MSEPSFSLEQLSTAVRGLSATVNKQGITITQLQAQNGLSFPVVSQIYKSHLVKVASCLIFWSLRHCFRHYVTPETITLLDALVEVLIDRWRYSRGDAERRAMLLSMPGPHCGEEIVMLKEARALRSGGCTPPHLYGQTPHNTIDGMNSSTLDWLLQEYSTIITCQNNVAHKTTPKKLSTFIKLLSVEDTTFYASIFKFVFEFPHTEIDVQTPDKQNQLVTNSSSYDTIYSLDPNLMEAEPTIVNGVEVGGDSSKKDDVKRDAGFKLVMVVKVAPLFVFLLVQWGVCVVWPVREEPTFGRLKAGDGGCMWVHTKMQFHQLNDWVTELDGAKDHFCWVSWVAGASDDRMARVNGGASIWVFNSLIYSAGRME